MNFTYRPSAIRVALPPAGQRLPQVDFLDDDAAPSPRRGGRPLVAYASPQGAAWFEALMAEIDAGQPLQRPTGTGTC